MTGNPPDTEELRSAAQHALDLALSDPRRAQILAARVVVTAKRVGDAMALSRARQAEGLALRSLERPQESVRALEGAVRAALRAGDREQAGRAQVSLALSLGYAGRNRHALRVLDRAAGVLVGVERTRLQVQRAVVQLWIGRPRAAVTTLAAALAELRRQPDPLWQARALSTLGVARVELGDFAGAESALAAAEQLFTELAQHADAAGNRHNRGWCAGLLGDIPAALAHYEVAEQRFDVLGLPVAELQLDRARVLLAAGLAHEARAVAERSLELLSRQRAVGARSEALLVLAEIALLLGDHATARDRAQEAAVALRHQNRLGRYAVARYTVLGAAWRAGERGRRLRRSAQRTAADLERAGLLAAAGEARLLAGRIALEDGDRVAGRRQLAAVAAGRRRGPARQRSQAWLAEALLRLDAGDQRGAAHALRAGLGVLEAHRASLGALELRARTAAHVEEIADLGRRIALKSGRPERVLRWTEYGRATALRLPPVRPPDDAELAASLAELRRLESAASAAGGAAARSRARLQERIQRRTRMTPGLAAVLPPPPSARSLAAALGHRTLVSYSIVDDRVYAVTVADGWHRLCPLGPAAPVRHELRFLHAALWRLIRPGRPAALATDDAEALAQAAARLDALLLAPLPGLADAAEVVVAPPASLSTVPWSLLPSVSSRPVVVAPSVTAWHETERQPVTGGDVVLVAGPDLAHARAEVDDLARLYGSPVTLTGDAARVAAVCEAFDGAAIAHVAAHGEVNLDNPLFSALRLADGPLMAYDIGQLKVAPSVVVLSACDSLAGAVYGEELLGMATALLHLGSRTVIGSLTPLPDATVRTVMRELHGHLTAGVGPAVALHRAREAVGSAAGTLLCFGYG